MADKYNELRKMQAREKGMYGDEAEVHAMQPKGKKDDGMVDMKRSKKEKKANAEVSKPMGEDYPYGLEIRLDEDSMDKLEADLPAAGKTVTVTARAKVRSSEVREDGEGKRRSCCLQITHMKLG